MLYCLICFVTGKGKYEWKKSGCIYDGDWKDDLRNGFGTYSVPKPDGTYRKQYAGGWKNDKKHVCCVFYCIFVRELITICMLSLNFIYNGMELWCCEFGANIVYVNDTDTVNTWFSTCIQLFKILFNGNKYTHIFFLYDQPISLICKNVLSAALIGRIFNSIRCNIWLLHLDKFLHIKYSDND